MLLTMLELIFSITIGVAIAFPFIYIHHLWESYKDYMWFVGYYHDPELRFGDYVKWYWKS